MAVPVQLAEGMPTTVGAEMAGAAVTRAPATPPACPAPPGWGTGAPTAPAGVGSLLQGREESPSPWTTFSLSMLLRPLLDPFP